MYTPKYFDVREFVPPKVYDARGNKAWELIDERILITADQLREAFGPTIINTWHSDTLKKAYGDRRWSGLRTIDYYGTFTAFENSFSQHKYGRAIDCLLKEFDADMVRQVVLEEPHEFPYIQAMELDTSWLHVDCRNCEAIKTFRP